jgi:hypothetical protein
MRFAPEDRTLHVTCCFIESLKENIEILKREALY